MTAVTELKELGEGRSPVLVLLDQVGPRQGLPHHGLRLLPLVPHNRQLQLPTELALPRQELGCVGWLRPDPRHPLVQLDPTEPVLVSAPLLRIPHEGELPSGHVVEQSSPPRLQAR